ncbi:MAG: NPCBM/NEW2 domain-containing protein [Planctomycetota bacterium]
MNSELQKSQKLKSLLLISVWSSIFTFAICLNPIDAQEGLNKARIRLVNGSSFRANIKSIDETGLLSGSRMIEKINLDEITEVNTGKALRSNTDLPRILLPNRGFLLATNILVENEYLTFDSPVVQPIPLRLENFAAIVWSNSEQVQQSISASSKDADTVIVSTKNGDRSVAGLLDTIDETHVSINYKGKTRKISLEKVRAVIPADLSSHIKNTEASIALTDGSKIIGKVIRFDGALLTIAVTSNFELQIKAEYISQIKIESDRIAYLSDLNPIRVEQQSKYAAARPWQKDKSLLGNPLKLKYRSDGKILEFSKGIGARSYTELVFENERFSEFRTVVGIDVETGGRGDCEMIVEGDGIQLWSRRVKADDDPESIVVNIEGIQKVSLIVREGKYFDLADHANWADARFTTSK